MLKKMILILFMPVILLGQEFNAKVIVNMDALNPGIKEKLENFGPSLEDYINKTKFTNKSWEGERIACTFNIIFSSATDNNVYTAQLIVNGLRPIEGTQRNSPTLYVLDSPWSFQYEKNQSFYFDQAVIDPITGMMDFYAYLMLGFDGDSYQKMGGSDYFKKAYEIALRGASSSKYAANWEYSSSAYNKRGLLENLLDEKYGQFRIDYYNYHYNGIDLISNPNKYDYAIKNIVALIKNIEKVRERLDSRSVLLTVFFNAKAPEICESLKNYPDKDIFYTLKKIDPLHISKYMEMAGK